MTGGLVTNTLGYLGYTSTGSGTATVSSGTWANRDDLWVGWRGTGTLNVSGGKVTNSAGVLGYNAGSVGTATVTGGTWANSGNLTVGGTGTGTLTMSGGLVTVGGTLTQGTSGTINLNAGGTLQIGVGGTTGVLGVTTLTNNGTLIFNRSNASTYTGIISGSGAVTKQGAGMLTLDGANSYMGLTTVSAGTLVVNGSIASTAGLNVDSGAFLSGSGSLASMIAGAGLVGPGNSPGIYFQVASLAVGDTFQGGFFTDATLAQSDLLSNVSAGSFNFFVQGDGSGTSVYNGVNYYTFVDYLTFVPSITGLTISSRTVSSANFATGIVTNGQVVELVAVPEPSTYALAAIGAGIVGLMHWRKRATVKIAS